jgi:uncharacterized protein
MIGPVNAPLPLHARVLDSITEVAPADWNGLLTEADPPVLDWHWLAALEASGSASRRRDWRPAHIGLFIGAELVGACPLYLRQGTDGEFVWSGAIHRACEEAGLAVGPRGVSTIPATPVSSRRMLTGPTLNRLEGIRLLGQALLEVMGANRLASLSLHFCADDEVETLQSVGWVVRRQWQYHWQNPGLSSFDELLGGFRARRRASIRRERREVASRGVTVEFVGGLEASDDLFAQAGRVYADTARRHGGGPPLLAPSFFAKVAASPLREKLLLGVARDNEGICALTFNVRGRDALYGRTWGASRPVPFLHFEVAYYAGLAWCIENGVERFEPGHGGEYKHKRGFAVTPVHSLHRFADLRLHSAIDAWAGRERTFVDERIAQRAPGDD